MVRIASPISHLFRDPKVAETIIELSDCLECRDSSINVEFNKQELFHCELQPIHKFTIEDFKYLEKIATQKPELKLISFHAATSCSNPILDGHMFQAGGDNYTKKNMLDNSKKNFSEIKKIFGSNVKVVIENNNYYPTEAYNLITDSDFLQEVVMENDIEFLLDIAHAEVTAFNKTIPFEEYLYSLPLNRIIQIHICQFGLTPDMKAYDAHDVPNEKSWHTMESIMIKYSNVKYITLEYYKNATILLQTLKYLRKRIDGIPQ
ncbi:MAG: DUF692 family protein [Bacteroidetes bacterium]|nr:DUF692 family protein [Bacteroidota bacterium]